MYSDRIYSFGATQDLHFRASLIINNGYWYVLYSIFGLHEIKPTDVTNIEVSNSLPIMRYG